MNRTLRAGVTLVEILIAVAIVAIAFFPIISTIQYGNKSTVKVNNYSRATKLAQGLIEECRHVPFKIYQETPTYKDLPEDQWELVGEDFFPKTRSELPAFQAEIKSLQLKPELKLIRNPDNTSQIKEIWFRVHISWKEGDGTTDNKPREVTVGNALHNSEAE